MAKRRRRVQKKLAPSILWMTLTIKGALWPVEVSSNPKDFHESTDEGCCDLRACKIYIASWLSETQKMSVLIHEILHAIFFSLGVSQVVESVLDAKEDEREERLISLLAGDLYDTLQRNGLLLLPKIPELPALIETRS
jgi:hypothetical protein